MLDISQFVKLKKSVFVVACDELIFNQSKSEEFKQG